MSLQDLPSREAGRVTEYQCPVCGSWKVAFLLTPTPEDRAAEVGGAAWVCDVERSRWAREARAAGMVWDAVSGAWQPDLDGARARQRRIINAARDAAQHGGAVTSFGTFDTSQRSLLFLNGAVAAAQSAIAASQPYALEWTRADDTVATLTAAETITAGLEVAAHIDAMHQRARVLKQRIDDADTLAAIAAIGWTLTD